MKQVRVTVAMTAMLLGLSAASNVIAGHGRGGHGGSHGGGHSGGHSASRSGGHGSGHSWSVGTGGSHHYHRYGGAYFYPGAAIFYPWPYPYYYPSPYYYYGPDYSQPHQAPPTEYVEQFTGMPTPETQDEIFCPSRGAYFPDALDCPDGWQRVFHYGKAPDKID